MSRQPVLLPYTDPAFVADPFPLYRQLREDGPVRRAVIAGGLEAWVVTRYEDGLMALSHPQLSSDVRDASDPRLIERLPAADQESVLRNMLRTDPPDHTRLRRLVSKAFTARRVAELRPRVQEIADRLLDEIVPAGRADLVESFALPLPVTVISELLGVPVADRYDFQRWTDDMILQGAEPPDRARVDEAWRHLRAYLTGLLEAKRARPGDDLLGALIVARDEEQRLDEEELIAMAFLLLVAGYITTVNLIGSGIAALLAHPDQLRMLRTDPALLPGAIEEFLRYDGPVNGIARFAREDVTLAGVDIPAARPCWWPRPSPTATRNASPNPTASTSPGRTTPTSPSGTASTTAWARRWPGWRGRSPSAPPCADCPVSPWPCRPGSCGGGRAGCAAPNTCRSPSPPVPGTVSAHRRRRRRRAPAPPAHRDRASRNPRSSMRKVG